MAQLHPLRAIRRCQRRPRSRLLDRACRAVPPGVRRLSDRWVRRPATRRTGARHTRLPRAAARHPLAPDGGHRNRVMYDAWWPPSTNQYHLRRGRTRLGGKLRRPRGEAHASAQGRGDLVQRCTQPVPWSACTTTDDKAVARTIQMLNLGYAPGDASTDVNHARAASATSPLPSLLWRFAAHRRSSEPSFRRRTPATNVARRTPTPLT